MTENGGAMLNPITVERTALSAVTPAKIPDLGAWYAIQTRSRHEKKVAEKLQEKGVCTFLPLVTALHVWSDRKRDVQLPLFPGYVFVCITCELGVRNEILRTDGVASFVGVRGAGVPISNNEIENIQTILAQKIPFSSYPFLKVGHRVRIRGGSLDGVEGILVARNGDRSLIVSVQLIQRSLAIRVAGYEVESIQ